MATKIENSYLLNLGKQTYAYQNFVVAQPVKEPVKQNTALQYLNLNYGANLHESINIINSGYNTSPKITFDSYKTTNDQFGVINHVDASYTRYLNAVSGISKLRSEFDVADEKNKTLVKRVREYVELLEKEKDIYDLEQIKEIFTKNINAWSDYQVGALKPYKKPGDNIPQPDEGPTLSADDLAKFKETNYSALFSTGDVIRSDIRLIDRLRRGLAGLHTYQQKVLTDTRATLAEVESKFAETHQQLANLNQQRLKTQGDYQVVRLLVAENWADVEKAYKERARILDNHKGLFYARVRETPVNMRPVKPLPLRFGNMEDLVPGYPLVDVELPDDLQPFMESVLDIPMSDWVSLAPHYKLLPTRAHLQKLLGYRKTRLDYRMTDSSQAMNQMMSARLTTLRYANQTLIRDYSRKIFTPVNSLVEYQRTAAQHLSLEDLLNGSPHRLRGLAENQRNKLDQATHSLLKELRKVTPSIRLEWSEAAELDTLDVTNPAQWPGLGKAENKDLNGIRTMVELVQWWWRQITPDASSTSYTAVRNLIRAALMISAADDPDQILHGQLQTLPGRFKLGDALRLTLNKEALPGTLLQLVDASNVLIGTLRIDDYDDSGAVATITQLQATNVIPSTNFTVTGFALPATKRG